MIEGVCEFTGSIASLGSSMMTTGIVYNGTLISSTGIAASGYGTNMSIINPQVHTVNYYDNYAFRNMSGFYNT